MKTVNDYTGQNDNECIEAAIQDRENGIVILPPRRASVEPERDYWLLDRAILLPENTTFVLQNCKIKLSDRCRDNFFRSANCGIGIEDVQRFSNIHIRGEGCCVLEGADHPRAVGDSSKTLSCPCPYTDEDLIAMADWIPEERKHSGKLGFWDAHDHSYGTDAGKPGEVQHGDWRGIGILLACVDDFSIENLRIVQSHGWGISLEDCAHGRLQHIDFDAHMYRKIDGMLHNMENQDGIDLRNGCHDILVDDITGVTGDDVIALTAIADTSGSIRPSGSLESTHVLHNDWSRRCRDIHDVIIRNVRAYSSLCYHIRLLPAEASIWNVVIDGLLDTAPAGHYDRVQSAGAYPNGGILLGEGDGGYGVNHENGLSGVTISNVVCYGQHAICIPGFLRDSVITNVVNRHPDRPVITLGRKNSLKRVLTSNLLGAGNEIIHQAD